MQLCGLGDKPMEVIDDELLFITKNTHEEQ